MVEAGLPEAGLPGQIAVAVAGGCRRLPLRGFPKQPVEITLKQQLCSEGGVLIQQVCAGRKASMVLRRLATPVALLFLLGGSEFIASNGDPACGN
jgi:hypothetical protein